MGDIAWWLGVLLVVCFFFVEELDVGGFIASKTLLESKKPVPKNTSDVPVAEVVSALAPTPRWLFSHEKSCQKGKTGWWFQPI